MRGIVVGGGSIGTRHLKNLKFLGVEELGLVEVKEERCKSLASDLDISAFSTLDKGLAWNPSFAVVATPTHLHVGQALQIAQSCCHVFVEKPLSHTAEGLVELRDLVKANRLVSMVGCNMRFHPGPSKVKELIQQDCCGKVLFAAFTEVPICLTGAPIRIIVPTMPRASKPAEDASLITYTKWILPDGTWGMCEKYSVLPII